MVNNLGGTSNLELLVIVNAAIHHLGKLCELLYSYFIILSVLSSGQAEDECGPCDLWQSDDFAGNGWCVSHTLENRACLGPVFRSVTEIQII